VKLPVMRVGLPEVNGRLPTAAERLGLPVLVSASRLWDARRRRFRARGENTWELDIALDSAGFTVMKQWGGEYPWSVEEYVHLGLFDTWAWFSQPDLCCEPEIADSAAEVERRVAQSADLLAEARDIARELRSRECARLGVSFGASAYQDCMGPEGMKWPMPVLQGWLPEHYRDSVRRVDAVLGGRWPEMVGVGSVCRRDIHGEDGLLSILAALDEVLPEDVGLHLFGVKGGAVPHLTPYLHRIASLDSMAWDFAARRSQHRKPADLAPMDWRIQHMTRWAGQQQERIEDLYREATADDLLEEIIGAVYGVLPEGVTDKDIGRWLARNTEGLHRLVVMELERVRYPNLSTLLEPSVSLEDGRHGPLLREVSR
jgi:hypothetical protein